MNLDSHRRHGDSLMGDNPTRGVRDLVHRDAMILCFEGPESTSRPSYYP